MHFEIPLFGFGAKIEKKRTEVKIHHLFFLNQKYAEVKVKNRPKHLGSFHFLYLQQAICRRMVCKHNESSQK
jgi:hypothetical protein